MKKRLAYALATLFLLTGCASGGQAAQVSSSTPSAAPSTPAEPVPMSIEEAGVYYLKNVCPSNHLSDVFGDALDVQIDRYNAGAKVNLKPVTKAAAKLRESLRDQVDAFSDKDVLWPSEVESDIEEFVDEGYEEVAVYAGVSEAEDFWGIYTTMEKYWEKTDRAVAQKIRAKLDLPADTVKSCKKYIDS